MSILDPVSVDISALEFDTPVLEAISGLAATDFSIAVQPFAAISISAIEFTAPALLMLQPGIPAAASGARRGHAVLVSELLHRRSAVAHLADKPDQVFCHAVAGTAPPQRVPLRASFGVAHVVDHDDAAKAFGVAYVAERLGRAA